MIKLILIMGIWINPVYVNYLEEVDGQCYVDFSSGRPVLFRASCDKIAKMLTAEM